MEDMEDGWVESGGWGCVESGGWAAPLMVTRRFLEEGGAAAAEESRGRLEWDLGGLGGGEGSSMSSSCSSLTRTRRGDWRLHGCSVNGASERNTRKTHVGSEDCSSREAGVPSGWERFLPLRRGGRGSESEEDCGRASMEGGGSAEGSKGEGDWIGGRALLWAESLSRDELLNA